MKNNMRKTAEALLQKARELDKLINQPYGIVVDKDPYGVIADEINQDHANDNKI
jgi:hypothetical protein